MDEALRGFRFDRLRPPEDWREERDWLLEQVMEGEFVLVYGRQYDTDHPMSPVLRWSTEKVPEGIRVPMRGYLSPWPDGIPPD